ncbi:MAG TPA: acetoacetate--CoA ligase [Saprospiraceae bacterium]|nr:acetoacetate--CoA ligase [Saprospiraceae bacterium]
MTKYIQKPLWYPADGMIKQSHLYRFKKFIEKEFKIHFTDYEEFWRWSVDDVSRFWLSIWKYYDIKYSGKIENVLSGSQMPHFRWFEGSLINFSEHLFQYAEDNNVVIHSIHESGIQRSLTWKDLRRSVFAFQQLLLSYGVGEGDRVVAYLPNIPEAVIACIAATSLGAIWSSCSPDFGVNSVIDRFAQIEPVVFIGVNGYSYNGRNFEKISHSDAIVNKLPKLKLKVMVPYLEGLDVDDDKYVSWPDYNTINENESLHFTRLPFDQPLWILFSSGTTGKPKAITHCHGGVLLELMKYITLHNDCKPGEKFFWYTTTGWMMWNYLFGAFLAGGTVVLYDGSPTYPDLGNLWRWAEKLPIHHFGTSAPFLITCMKEKFSASELKLDHLRSIGSTGAPLPPETFEYVYKNIKSDVWLCSMSGGTDVCTAFAGGNIMKPVYAGKIQSRALGCALCVWDAEGNPVVSRMGEMVIEKPMPSMPVFFWNDPGNKCYMESYFETFPGVWRHGDWISLDEEGQITIYGRSDATLNRQGIRIGTSEIYSAVHRIAQVEDALIVNIEKSDGSHFMPLFVKMKPDEKFSGQVVQAINQRLRDDYTPRHVPDIILEVPDIPFTISGKKLEAPVKYILSGKNHEEIANKEALRNPEALDYFITHKDTILKYARK